MQSYQDFVLKGFFSWGGGFVTSIFSGSLVCLVRGLGLVYTFLACMALNIDSN